MIPHFIGLFEYNDWANRRILDVLARAEGAPDRCRQLMTHLLAAQQIWLNRIAEVPNELGLWAVGTIEELQQHSEKSTQNWLSFWHSFDENDFSRIINYRNSQGNAYQSTIHDIVTHLINHSTYHRAQINQLLRQNGFEPILTDYIAYRRVQTGQII